MIYLILRITITTLLGVASGLLTVNFTRKKDSMGKYLKSVGYPLFSAKVTAGFLIGVLGWFPMFPLIRGVIVALAVGLLGIAFVFRKLDNKKDAVFILGEFMVLGVVTETIGTYVDRKST